MPSRIRRHGAIFVGGSRGLYTHYWYVDKDADRGLIVEAGRDMAKVVAAASVPLGNWEGKPGTLPEIDLETGKVWFNGIGDDANEAFSWPPDLDHIRRIAYRSQSLIQLLQDGPHAIRPRTCRLPARGGARDGRPDRDLVRWKPRRVRRSLAIRRSEPAEGVGARTVFAGLRGASIGFTANAGVTNSCFSCRSKVRTRSPECDERGFGDAEA